MSKIGAPLSNATFLKPTAWSAKKEYKLYDCVKILYGTDILYTYMAIRDVPKGKNPNNADNSNYWKKISTNEDPK